MLIDTFTFYNELEMLEYRLDTLGPVVDAFVIVEATLTYRGLPKKLYYQENKSLFEKWNHKIIHVVVSDLVPNAPDPWVNEFEQRNQIARHITFLKDDDIIINSDLDEIPNPEIVKNLSTFLENQDAASLGMDLYYYNLETRVGVQWNLPKAMRYRYTKKDTLTVIRQHKLPVIPRAGWHMSYFGDAKFIINKLKNFAHLEVWDLYSWDDENMVNFVIDHGFDLFGREDNPIRRIPRELNDNLPPCIDQYSFFAFSDDSHEHTIMPHLLN